MQLKRLEIQGFKSFADKIDFQFTDGVTIVVGPNGSGKSNISDSIRWVMGEQSAKSLRGSKMEDIIFAGSDKRRPVGLAEVSMTMDNSDGRFPLDFSEITVTRRAYRSGESDFLINKVPCRLRDIHELFMDTGIGKETYSIIGQGKVEQILSARPEERRSLIEEAAGIVKYRSRKQEALRKLDDTQVNLNRVSDIIQELEGQLEPLAEQAERALAYQQYHGELETLEVNLMVNQLEDQKQRLDEARKLAEKLQSDLLSRENVSVGLEAEIEGLRLSLTKFDEELSGKQQHIFQLTSEMERNEGEIKVRQERSAGLEEQKTRLNDEVTDGQARLAALEGDYGNEADRGQQLAELVEHAAQALTAKEAELKQLEASLVSGGLAVEESKADIIELLNSIAATKNELAGLVVGLSGSRKRADQLVQARSGFTEQLEGQQERLADLLKQAEQAKATMESWQNQAEGTRRNQETAGAELATLGEELRKSQAAWQSKQSRLKVLQELQQHFEGYQRGVREILQARQKGEACARDVRGVVAELIKVPGKYETAIEVALGGSLQFMVTNTDQGAKQAIQYLKTHKLGRATFLPLNIIKGQSLRGEEEKALKLPGALGRADQLVECEPEFRNIVENLLGRIVIVENLDQALQIARSTNHRVRLVTLDGDVINPGGSLTGGSLQHKGNNLLGRTREIDELGKALGEISSSIERAKTREQELKAQLQQEKTQLEQLSATLQQGRIAMAELDKDILQVRQETERLEKAQQLQDWEESQVAEEINSAQERQQALEAKLAEQEQQYSRVQESVNAQQEEAKKGEADRQLLLNQVTEQKVNLASITQEEQGLKQSLHRYNQNKHQLEKELKQKSAAIIEITTRQQQLAAEIEELREAIREQVVLLEERNQVLADSKSERTELAGRVQEKEREAREYQQQLAKVQQELHGSELKQTRLEAEVEAGTNRLWEEYQITYEEALLNKEEISNRRTVQARINQLKSDITALGLVNLGAIEENQRVRDRYDFLSTQFTDLTEARDSLYHVISEINEIMTVRFAEAYTAINQNFIEVFQKLFGGGRAELVLTEKDNLLETGLDIIAQPPGKKPQHLSLLSGGERALTAISLLFAILTVKPSPFCVLDEIEASLDEANVKRFADFVREFSRETQFIVVTHRKGTMEIADSLYGVTMDETGVSKVVSMKFEDKNA